MAKDFKENMKKIKQDEFGYLLCPTCGSRLEACFVSMQFLRARATGNRRTHGVSNEFPSTGWSRLVSLDCSCGFKAEPCIDFDQV